MAVDPATRIQIQTWQGLEKKPDTSALAAAVLDHYDILDGTKDGMYNGMKVRGDGAGAPVPTEPPPPYEHPPAYTPAAVPGTTAATPGATAPIPTDPPPSYTPPSDAVASDPPATHTPASETGASSPVATDPVATDPVATDPVTTDPVTTDPVATDPVATDPVATDPVATEPVASEAPATETGDGGDTKDPMANLGNQFGFKDALIAAYGEKGASKWLKENGYGDGKLDGLTVDKNGQIAIIYDSEFDQAYRKLKGEDHVLRFNHVHKEGDGGSHTDDPQNKKGENGLLPGEKVTSKEDNEKNARDKPFRDHIDSMDDKFGWKAKLLAAFDGDRDKANLWLESMGPEYTQTKLDGLAKDDLNREVVLYNSPLDMVLRKANNTKDPVEGMRYVSEPGKGSAIAGQKSLPQKFYEGELYGPAYHVKSKDPKVWRAVNEAFHRGDGKVDLQARDDYLYKLCDESVSDKELGWIRDRFTGKFADKPLIKSRDDFTNRTNVKDLAKYAYVCEALDKHKGNPYVLDQLHVRFSGQDGILDENEARAMNDYIKGRIWKDVGGGAGTWQLKEDWNRLTKDGCRPTPAAVDELLKDNTVLNRLDHASFDGDHTGAGRHTSAWRGGKYTEK